MKIIEEKNVSNCFECPFNYLIDDDNNNYTYSFCKKINRIKSHDDINVVWGDDIYLPIPDNCPFKTNEDNLNNDQIIAIFPKLVNSLKECMNYMEILRKNPDAGLYWKWDNDEYTRAVEVLKEIEK